MDSLNVHFAGVDEVHEHPNPEIIQKLNTATGARRQPLIFEITTAGHDRHSVCRQHHEFSVKALEGTIPTEASDSWFVYIATIDAGDDWTDPAVWIKANPSLGVTVKVEDLKRQVDEAREMPAQQNAIRRLRLNEWTEQVTRWLDMAVWDEGGPPPATDWRTVKEELDDLEAMLAGRTCYGGLDLARVNDLSAFVLLFPPTGDEDLGTLADRWINRDAIFLMLNAATPFITPDPPWLANLPLVVAIMAFLLAFGLSHMRAERARAGESTNPKHRSRQSDGENERVCRG